MLRVRPPFARVHGQMQEAGDPPEEIVQQAAPEASNPDALRSALLGGGADQPFGDLDFGSLAAQLGGEDKKCAIQ